MTSNTSISRIVVPSLTLIVACCAALVFGFTHLRHEPPVETRAGTAAPAFSPPALGAREEGSAGLATAQAEANAAAALAESPRAPDTDELVPGFDIARIERTGEAVIAGSAAPGASVELLRNGDVQDRVVADQSGQFVMVPPQLPPGDYELTLRSTQPDGKQATSKQSVVVALEEVKSSSGAVRSRGEVPFDVPATAVANRRPPHAAAATSLSNGGASSAVVVSKIATTIVSRGDSLWRIGRLTYGVGMRYAVVYKANRDQIRNPNLIHPGQIFVLPTIGRPNAAAIARLPLE